MVGAFPQPNQHQVHRDGKLCRGRGIGFPKGAIDIALFQERTLRHAENASNRNGVAPDNEGFSQQVQIRREPPGKRLAQDHLAPVLKHALVPGQECLRQEFENLRIDLVNLGAALNVLSIELGRRTIHVDSSRRLHIRDTVLHDGHFTRPGRLSLIPSARQRVKAFVVRCFPGDADLLPGVTKDDNHERQAHDQPRRLDGGVELVAG